MNRPRSYCEKFLEVELMAEKINKTQNRLFQTIGSGAFLKDWRQKKRIVKMYSNIPTTEALFRTSRFHSKRINFQITPKNTLLLYGVV